MSKSVIFCFGNEQITGTCKKLLSFRTDNLIYDDSYDLKKLTSPSVKIELSIDIKAFNNVERLINKNKAIVYEKKIKNCSIRELLFAVRKKIEDGDHC